MSKNDYSKFFNLSHDLFSISEGEFFIELNDAWESTLGWTRAELLKHPYSYFLHPDDLEKSEKAWQSLLRTSQIVGFTNRYRCSNGEYKTLTWNCVEVEGQGSKVYAVARDVTDTHAQAETLKKSQKFIEDILNAIPDPIFVKDEEHRWIYANSAFATLLGRPASEFIGKSDYDFFPKAMADVFWEKDNDIFKRNVSNENEESIIDPKGETRTIITKKVPSTNVDGTRVLVGTIWDITDRRSVETKLVHASKMATLGEMAGGIAHEINNPLTIIMGFASRLIHELEDGSLTPTTLDVVLRKIVSTCDRIGKIVRSLRTFARDGLRDPFESRTVVSLVESIMDFCAERFKNSSVELRIDRTKLQQVIDCQPVQLSQVLLNLINNSFDAIQNRDERWIQIECNESDTHVEIRVIDSGSGIPEHLRPKLMQPFFSTKDVNKGVGLGLSLSQAIAKDHHGELRLDANHPNTCFVLDLPKVQEARWKTRR